MKTSLDSHDQPDRDACAAEARCPPSASAQAARQGEPSTPILRARMGRMALHYRTCQQPHGLAFSSSDAVVHMVAPVRGTVIATTQSDRYEVAAGQAFLLGRSERATCAWQGDAAAVLLSIPRQSLQVVAFERFGQPRRLAAANLVFPWAWYPGEGAGAVGDYAAFAGALLALPGPAAETLAARRLVEAIARAHDRDMAFPVARSVERALERVRCQPDIAWTVAQLEAVAGVTAAVLSRNFSLCLGVTVAQVMRDARLDWLHGQLRCAHESRSIGQLALAAGYATAGQLTRIYQRRFGETPIQTRASAFATMT